MKHIVKFSKNITQVFGMSHIEIDVNSYRDIISGIINLIPDSKSFKDRVFIIDGTKIVNTHELDFKPKNTVINIVPAIGGNTVPGFDSLGNLIQFYGTTTAIGNQELALTGLTKRIVESSLFGRSQTSFDISQRASNRETGLNENTNDPTTGFGSLTLTSVNGQNIPLLFGRVRTSGAVISQHIKHIQRGGIDTVSVSDYI